VLEPMVLIPKIEI